MFIRIHHYFIIGCLLLLLAACGGHRTRVIDTPATRELEGWQKPYEVDGIRYYPLKNHQGYQERGIASWYGGKFHGRKTSNGETYDMHALSAAHKTLPMGVYVKVTHLASGHNLVVRINDRGPFVAGRIIDLSYRAAQRLGIVESGTAQVQLQALGYRKNDPVNMTDQPPTRIEAGSFAVQIAAFVSSARAYQLAERFRRAYGQAVVTVGSANGKRIHRVRIGSYSSLEQAEEAVLRLTAAGFPGSFVVAFD